MPDIDPRTLAQERLAARRHRFQRIRKRVAAGTVAVFIALFAGLTIQLASGGDPGLAAQSSRQAATGVVTTAASSSTDTQGSSTSTSRSSSTPSSVTTSQS